MFSNTWIEAFLRRYRPPSGNHDLPEIPVDNRVECVELEPRVLYSASPIGIDVVTPSETGFDVDPALFFDEPVQPEWADEFGSAATLTDEILFSNRQATEQATEIVFIADNAEGYQELIDNITGDPTRLVDVFVLDSQQDGAEAISHTLANYQNLQAIHFVTHGNRGQIELGNLMLSHDNLTAYAGQIASWNNALDSGADLLFYGCDLAATEAGQLLAESISELCDCDVAASDDLTGHASLGGDWNLEYATGDVTAEFIFSADVQRSWISVLSATETGDVIDVNTFVTDAQETNNTGGQTVATNDAGNSVVVWQGKKQDVPGAGDYGVFAQIFDANGIAVGAEIAVNEFVTKDQMSPTVAMADDGSFVVVWASEDQDGDQWGIYGMRFDASGNKLDVPGSLPGTHEFQINVHTTGNQNDPAIASDGSGNFVVTWTSDADQAGANSKSDIFFRRFDSTGIAIDATDQLVNTQISFEQFDSSVDMNDAGQFVVSWTADSNQDGNGLGVFAQKFAADGNTIGSEILVNSTTDQDQYDASIAIDSSGSFAVVFSSQDHPLGTGRDVIIAQRFDTTGSKVGAEIHVSAGLEAFDHLAPAVDMTDDGRFVVSWTNANTSEIYYQEFSTAGTPQDQLQRVDTSETDSQLDSSVALRNSGDFIVAWWANGDVTLRDDKGVFAQRFTFDNEASEVNLPSPPITFFENSPPIIIDPTATVTDIDSTDFDGGRLIVDFIAGGTANDRLAIHHQGTLPGQIGVSGSDITWGGLTIGTYTGGVASTPLVITFNANGTVAAAEALVRNITFENLPNDTDTSDRSVRFVLIDGDGGTADPAVKIISITQVNDAPNIQGITSKTIAEDNRIQFQNTDLISITDVDAGSEELRVTMSVTHGTISLGTTNSLTFYEGTLDGDPYLVFSGTLDRINAALDGMEYVPTKLYVGSDQLVIHVDDQGNTGAGGALTDDHVVDITIGSDGTNDTPINIKPANQNMIEDDQLVFSSENGNRLWIQDDSGTEIIRVTLEVTEAGLPSTNATLTLASLFTLTFDEGDGIADSRIVVNGTLDDINDALNGMLFEPTSGYTGQLKITVSTEDLGSQGTGGPESDFDEVQVNVLERNDPPVITAPDSVTTSEGISLVFDVSQPIDITDPDATGDIQVTLDVSNGIITLGSAAGLNFVNGANNTSAMTLKGDQAEIGAALNNLTYTPDAGYAGPDNLQITVDDLGGVGAGGNQVDAETIEILVTADGSNADPVNSVPSTQNTAEETPLELSTRNGNRISINDDAGTDLIKLAVEVNDGTLTLSNTVGTEFDVNNFATGDQEVPQVAMDQDGNYVVVWQSHKQDGSGEGIYAQLFNANGIKTGPEFLVNERTAGNQTDPTVSMDKDGNFVIAWTGKGDNGADSQAVFARLFDNDGNDLSGGELLVNETTTGDQSTPAVAMNWQTGDFVITWQTKGQIDDWDIFARQYSFDLLTIGNEFQVNHATTQKQNDPSIDINDSGEFIIGWESNILGDENLEVVYRRFDWSSGAIDLTDRTANDNLTKNQENAAVALDNAGNYVVAWQSKDQDYADDKYGIYAQIWDNTGTEIKNEFRINDTLPRNQSNPSVAMDENGNFIVSWQSDSAKDSSDYEVYAKRFDVNGNPDGDEFLVNLTADKDQANPDVALNRNGDFVIVWQSEKQDTADSLGIFGQSYKDIRKLNFIEGDGTADARIVLEGTLKQINDALDGLVYTPDTDFVGTDTLTITTDDQHATDPRTDVDSLDIIVGPTNDAPVITIPGLQTISQDNPLTFNPGTNGISISDVDAGTTIQDVILISNHGTLTLWNMGGLTALTGNGTDRITLSGTLADINAAFDGMQFDPTSGFAGSASIFLRIDDPGELAAGDELSSAQTIFIQIDSDGLNDAPEINLPSPQRTDQNVGLFLDSVTGNQISINDDAGNGLIEVSLNVANGTITLSDGASGDIRDYSIQAGNQTNPDVGTFDDGSYVVVWESPNQDGNGLAIVGQRFSSAGHALSDEFVINSFVTGNQTEASIATSTNGNFVVTWESLQDGGGLGVYGQLFDNAGQAMGSEFVINTTTADDQESVDVAMADDGSFVAIWQSSGNLDGNGDGIFAQRFDANGVTLGNEFVVNTTFTGNQTAPAIAMSGATGDFVVAWQSADNNLNGIFAQRFHRDGSPAGNQFLVNTTTLNDQTLPDVAMDDAGNFAITWQSANEDGSGKTIAARLYNNLGQPQGSGLIVNEFVAGDQEAPAVAMNSITGDFVILWQSANQDGDGDAVVGQRFDAAGVKTGSELIVNSDPTGNQTVPAVSMNSDGEIVAAFVGEDSDQDGVFVKKILPSNAIELIAGDGINDSFITIRGTLDHVNAALDGLRFSPTVDFEGIASISVAVDDLGNSGGTQLTDEGILQIAVGDALFLDLDADNSSASGAVFETNFVVGGGPVAIADADVVIDDPANSSLVSMTITITNVLDGGNEILDVDVSGTAISVVSNAGGILSLGGTDSIANYESVLSRITYDNTHASPTYGDRIIDVVVNNGTSDSNVAQARILYPGGPVDITIDSFTVDEHIDTTSGYSVGTLLTDDPDIMESFTYTILAGADGLLFSIGGAANDELILTDGVLDFETKSTYTVNVEAEDSSGQKYNELLTVNVTDLNDAPTVGLTNLISSLAEDTDTSTAIRVADIVVSDDALGTNNLTLSGADAASFEIVGTELRLKAGTTLDFATKSSFDVTVEVDDTAIAGSPDDTAVHALSISDGNETPTTSGIPDFSLDEDPFFDPAWYNLHLSFDDTEDPSPAMVYSVEANTNSSLFDSVTISGGKFLRIDFADDQNGTSDITVRATDAGGLFVETTFRITLNPVNDDPFVASPISPMNVDEDAVDSAIDLDTVFDDVDILTNGDTLSYSLVSNSAPSLVTTSLVGSNFTLDYQDDQFGSATIVVRATDSFGRSTTETIDVTVNLVNEDPVIDDQAFEIDENSANGTIVGNLVASDVDSGNLTYVAIGGTGTTAFSVDGAGQITVNDASLLNFETTPSLTLNVEVTDDAGATDSATITINLIDVNETPSVSLTNLVNSLSENADTTSSIRIAEIVIADDALGTNNLELTGVDASDFEIVGMELRLRAGTVLDFETQPSFDVSVEVDDIAVGSTPDDMVDHRLNVTDTNEAPTLLTNQLSLSEGQTVVLTSGNLAATDIDNPDASLTFLVSNVNGGRFALASDPGTELWSFTQAQVIAGEILFIDNGDELSPSYDVTVSDGGLSDGPVAANLTFTNINDGPIGTDDVFTIGTRSAFSGFGLLNNDFDPDSATLTTMLDSAPANGSAIVNPDGSFFYIPAPEFSGTDSFTYTINDGMVGSDPVTVVVNVLGGVLLEEPELTETTHHTQEREPLVSESEPTLNIRKDRREELTTPLELLRQEVVPLASVTRSRDDIQVDPVDLSQLDLGYNSEALVLQFTGQADGTDLDQLRGRFMNNEFMNKESWFWKALDNNKSQLQSESGLTELLMGSSAALASSITVGYLVWLIKGGQVLAAVMANLPAWRLIDPLPILSSIADNDDDDDSLQTIIEEGEDELESPKQVPSL